MKEETNYYDIALRNFKAAKLLMFYLDGDETLLKNVAYHLQQTIELAIKHILFTHGIDEIKITAGSTTLATVSSEEIQNGNWSTEIEIDANKVTTIKIQVTDLALKQAYVERDIYYDTKAPVVAFVKPENNNLVVSSLPYTTQGTVNDGTGMGVSKVYVAINDGEAAEATYKDGDWSYVLDNTVIDSQGYKTIKVIVML